MNQAQRSIALQMAIECAGNENGGAWSTKRDQVMRGFGGQYSIGEIETLLADMKRVQAEFDRITSQRDTLLHRSKHL